MRHILFKYNTKLITDSRPKLKDLLKTKIDPDQAINRSRVYIILLKKR